MQQIPVWKEDPIPVMVRCEDIFPWPDGNDLMVQIQTTSGRFTGFVDAKYVRTDEKLLVGAVIADVGNAGDWLVHVPVEALNAGPRIAVKAEEREKLLVFSTSPVV